MTALSILLIGLLLGMKHATEADHLAAVATLVTRGGSLAHCLRQGAAWGVGHTLTLMLFGGLIFALGRSIPGDLERALETAVGIMLVVLGVDVLRRMVRDRIHFHVHRHAHAAAHVHAHSHRDESVPHAASPHDHRHAARRWPLRALAVGMMHGLAGSAALVMLSVKSAESPPLGIGYIALFGLGSIVGMAALSLAIAVPLRLSAGYLAGLHRSVTVLIGLSTCVLGLWMIAEIGLLADLFSSHAEAHTATAS